MGASDLTTETLEPADGDRAAATNGHVSKKRKRQKALAAVAANGHVSKVALRKANGSNGASVVDEPPAGVPALDEPREAATAEELEAAERKGVTVEELDEAQLDGAAVEEFDETQLASAAPPLEELDDVARADAELDGAAVQAPAFEELDDVARGGATVDDLDEDELREDEPAADDASPADGGRRSRKRAAKRAKVEAKEAAPRGRAARRAKARRSVTPAVRRAELVATAAGIAAAAAAAEAQPVSTGRNRAAKIARRLCAIVAVAMIPGAVYALVVSDHPTGALSPADAKYMSTELMSADQRVRTQLVRLRARRTSPALAGTRDATLTARSLAIELANTGGNAAALLRRALKLEAAWLDAVGSVLSNPRSPLRGELVARDALLRPALNALPVPEGRRKGGAEHLARYAESRVQHR